MQVKVCPRCDAEYFAHIAECADCEVPLVSPDEAAGKERASFGGAPEAPIREGNREWVQELADMLDGRGVAARIALAPGCSAGGCGAKYILSVPVHAVSDAQAEIEEYFREMHPEARASEQNAQEGKCPACGHAVAEDARECADCGLVLLVEFDEG